MKEFERPVDLSFVDQPAENGRAQVVKAIEEAKEILGSGLVDPYWEDKIFSDTVG